MRCSERAHFPGMRAGGIRSGEWTVGATAWWTGQETRRELISTDRRVGSGGVIPNQSPHLVYPAPCGASPALVGSCLPPDPLPASDFRSITPLMFSPRSAAESMAGGRLPAPSAADRDIKDALRAGAIKAATNVPPADAPSSGAARVSVVAPRNTFGSPSCYPQDKFVGSMPMSGGQAASGSDFSAFVLGAPSRETAAPGPTKSTNVAAEVMWATSGTGGHLSIVPQPPCLKDGVEELMTPKKPERPRASGVPRPPLVAHRRAPPLAPSIISVPGLSGTADAST